MSTVASPGLVNKPRVSPTPETEILTAPIVYPRWRNVLLGLLTVTSAISMAVTFYLALFYAETDSTQGNVQRILYMHVGAFSGAAVAFTVTVFAGVAYLVTRHPRWDRLAVSTVGIGLPLSTITLLTGAIWARPTWNTWWTRDPRLDSMLVMWVIYAAYLALRSVISSPERRARFAAVYGILAFVSVIYTTIITRERTDTLHPVVLFGGSNPDALGSFDVTARMDATIGISSMAWTLTAITLIWYRVRVEDLFERVRALRQQASVDEP